MPLKVNGELLVDAGFGVNGFYLPFDPAQTGAVYPPAVTGSANQPLQTPGDRLFDGDLGENGAVRSNSANGAVTNWTPDTDITGDIELYIRNGLC